MITRSLCVVFVFLAQAAMAQPLFPDRNDYLADPNFPLSSEQVLQVKDQVHDLLPHMRPTKDVPVEFTVEGMFTSTFNMFETKISIYKFLGGAAPVFSFGREKGLALHKHYVSVTLMHEYAHSVLQQYAEAQDPRIITYLDTLKAQAGRVDLSEEQIAQIMRRQAYYVAYHEFFADLVGFLLTEDPKVFQKVLHHAYGRDFGNFPERNYESPMKKSHVTAWSKSARASKADPLAAVDAYSVFWPQRQAVVELLKAGASPQDIARGFASVMVDGMSHVIQAADAELDHEKLNSRFNEKARESFGRDLYRPAFESKDIKTKEGHPHLSMTCKAVYRG